MILGDILFIMKKLIDQKKHFKMYKSGKTWVVAGIAAVSLLIGSMQVVHADETSVDSQKTIVSASLQPKSTDAESSISVKGTEATSQPNVAPVDKTTDVKNNVADGSDSQDKPLTDSAEMTNESTTIKDTKDQVVEPKTNADSQNVGQKNDATVTPNLTEYYNPQNGHWYLKDQNGNNLTGWQKLSGNRTVYYNTTGEMLYGEQNISSKWYFFNTTDGNVAKGWYKLPDGRQVYYDVDSDGNGQGMLHGMQKIGNDYYYFNSGYGTEESGLKEVNGKYYYFSPVMIKNTEKEANGAWYYFGADGAAKIGWYTLSDGRLVNYNDQGQMYHGEAKINGKWYYFDATSGKVAQGWYKLPDGRQVYYDVDNNGNGQSMLHGMQKIGDNYHYFNPGYGTEESGLKEVNGKYYYFSPVMIRNTEKEVNGAWYYFGDDGTARTGWYTLSDGRLVKYNDQGQMNHGEAKINGKWYYFDATSGKVAQGWYKLPDGRQVYYDVDNNGNGQGMLHGMQKIGNEYYYFNVGYGTEESGLKNANGKYYYFSPTMIKNTEKEVNGSWYYFGSDGAAKTGWYTLSDGRLVNYNNQGQMYHGEAKINGKWYYFDATSGKVAQGWYKLPDGRQVYYDVDNNGNGQGMLHGMQKVGNEYYYFNPGYGAEESGLKEVNGKYYYFSPVMIKNTEKELNGSWYYFGADGAARTGWYTLLGGRLVNYNAQGQMYHGEAKIDGNWFYFNSIDGNVLQGWQKLADGRRVYYDIDYKDANDSRGMLHGEQLIDNVTYYFNLQNGAQETGVVYNLATKQLQYYGAANGSLSKNVEATVAQHTIKTDDEGNIILNDGQNQVDGQWYYYDSNNHVLVTGWKKLSDSQKVYYDPDTAQMIHGEKKIDGFWFYFDKWTGDEAISKFIKLADGRTVYYDENGHMAYGEKQLGNDWYYFNLNDGNEAVSNFIKLGDGRTVYYNDQGHMVYGWQNINGNTYYFNGQDGNMYVGAQWINGQEYYFDYITGAQVKDQWTAKLLEWFFNRMGKLTYSMDGSRNGADGTADCSGSLTQALYEAGAWRYSLLYNTEMLHSYLLGNGYHLAYENNGYTSPVVGDVIIWGQRGRSAGGAGHTGVISGSGRNGTMVSTCYWTEGEKGTAVQNFPYFWYWGEDSYPYYYVYRR